MVFQGFHALELLPFPPTLEGTPSPGKSRMFLYIPEKTAISPPTLSQALGRKFRLTHLGCMPIEQRPRTTSLSNITASLENMQNIINFHQDFNRFVEDSCRILPGMQLPISPLQYVLWEKLVNQDSLWLEFGVASRTPSIFSVSIGYKELFMGLTVLRDYHLIGVLDYLKELLSNQNYPR
ncbi:hypothetical protein NUACC26_085040 [Scytonema sp. NUACC26]